MKFLAGLIVLAAALQPYPVCGDAAAATSSNGGAAAAAASNGGGAAAAASNGGGAAAAAASSSRAPPPPPPPRANVPCNCNRVYDPVCGTNGRTYSNKCVLECVSAINVSNGYGAIAVKRRGECPRNPCQCKNVIKPVCGSDRNTYANECYVRCENARRKNIGLGPIKFTYGRCRRNVCTCSDVVIPVCGTDNRTYRNICVLQCASRNSQSQGRDPIFSKYSGACRKESCNCKPVNEPLCGRDGYTYQNRCELDCQNRRRDQLEQRPVRVAYNGVCIKNCKCPNIYDPVCAGNVTFANTCTLSCTNARRVANKKKPLKISSAGVCPCPCTLVYDPVCGKDERTYANPCRWRCENKRRADLGLRQIRIDYRGRCVCDCSGCSRNYDPVCGNDGRTYWNKCWLDCNRNCNSDNGRPLYVIHYGPC